MPTISSEDFITYYQTNFDVGVERLKELMPKDCFLDLNDFIQAPDQIWPDFEASLMGTERENILDAWAKLRSQPDPHLRSLFLPAGDPPREHTVNPPPPGGPILPNGFSPTNTVLVGERRLPRGDQLAALGITGYAGPQVFVKHVANIDTKNWVVAAGNVNFTLMEGPNAWGPWTTRCDFSLGPNERHEGCRFNKLVWWALAVSSRVSSKFTALPFAW